MSHAKASFAPARRSSAAWLWVFVPIVAVGGWWYPYLGLLVIGCMLAPVAVAAVRGRYWCGWLCPRGAFFDAIMARVSRHRPAPAWLRGRAFRIGMLAFLMTVMTVQLVLAYPHGEAMARVFVLLLGVTTLAGLVLAIVYQPRTWCTFCPMGTMSSWVAVGRRPLQVSAACRDCGACGKVCPMSLAPHRVDATHADCLQCERCVARCPVKALSFTPPTDIR